MTSRPPPTCTTGNEIPKNARMYVPTKYDPTSRAKLFMAIRHDNAFRASGAYSPVSARKKGLPPSGSTMGKSALRTRSKLFAASSIAPVATPLIFLRARPQVLFGSATSLSGQDRRHRDSDGHRSESLQRHTARQDLCAAPTSQSPMLFPQSGTPLVRLAAQRKAILE